MDETIFLALLQDGLTTGAIYVLLAVGLLIAFSVTRVIFIPQGDLVSFAALTLASMIGHQVPGTIWLLDGLCGAALVLALRRGRWRPLLVYGVAPAVLTLACWRGPVWRTGVGFNAAVAGRSSPRWGRCCTGSPMNRWARRPCWRC